MPSDKAVPGAGIDGMIADVQRGLDEAAAEESARLVRESDDFLNYKLLVDMIEVATKDSPAGHLSADITDGERAIMLHVAVSRLGIGEDDLGRLIGDYRMLAEGVKAGAYTIGSPALDPRYDDCRAFVKAISKELRQGSQAVRVVNRCFKFFNIRFKEQHKAFVDTPYNPFARTEAYTGEPLIHKGTPLADLVMKDLIHDARRTEGVVDEDEYRVILAFGKAIGGYEAARVEELREELSLEDDLVTVLMAAAETARRTIPDRRAEKAKMAVIETGCRTDLLRGVARSVSDLLSLADVAYQDGPLTMEELALLRHAAKQIYGIRGDGNANRILGGYLKRPRVVALGEAAKELEGIDCAVIGTDLKGLPDVLARHWPDMIYLRPQDMAEVAVEIHGFKTDVGRNPPPIAFERSAVDEMVRTRQREYRIKKE